MLFDRCYVVCAQKLWFMSKNYWNVCHQLWRMLLQSNSVITNSWHRYNREALCSKVTIWDQKFLKILFVIAVNLSKPWSLQPGLTVKTLQKLVIHSELRISNLVKRNYWWTIKILRKKVWKPLLPPSPLSVQLL